MRIQGLQGGILFGMLLIVLHLDDPNLRLQLIVEVFGLLPSECRERERERERRERDGREEETRERKRRERERDGREEERERGREGERETYQGLESAGFMVGGLDGRRNPLHLASIGGFGV